MESKSDSGRKRYEADEFVNDTSVKEINGSADIVKSGSYVLNSRF